MVERQLALFRDRRIVAFQPQRVGVLEHAPGLDHAARCAAWPTGPSPPVSVAMTLSLRARTLSMSIWGGRIRRPSPRQFVHLGDHAGHVQQGLRGDAAAEQAGAAEPAFGLDQRDLLPCVGRQKAAAYPPGPPPRTTTGACMPALSPRL